MRKQWLFTIGMVITMVGCNNKMKNIKTTQTLFDNWRNFLREDFKPVHHLKEQKKYPKNFNYSYSFGELGAADGWVGKNESKFMYGASMNKPILAFINLVLSKRGAAQQQTGKPIRALTEKELSDLITYTNQRGGSNPVNRALSNYRYNPKNPTKNRKYYQDLSREIGVTQKQTREVLDEIGLGDTIEGVRWGGKYNKQSPLGYSKFMSKMIKFKNDSNSEFHEEAKKVLSFIQKRHAGAGAYGLKKYLNKELENAGYGSDAIKSIYGKGGYIKGYLNYSIVINDKYIFSLYSKQPGSTASKIRPNLRKITLNTIKDNTTPEQFMEPAKPVNLDDIPSVETFESDMDKTEQPPVDVPSVAIDSPEEIFEPRKRTGKFVHGIKPIQNFDFDKFYDALDTQFADEGGAQSMLPSHGKDYKFGREHLKALQKLAKHVVKTPPPTEGPSTASVATRATEEIMQSCPDGTERPAGTCPTEPQIATINENNKIKIRVRKT